MKNFILNGAAITFAFFVGISLLAFIWMATTDIVPHVLSTKALNKWIRSILYGSIIALPLMLIGYNYVSLSLWNAKLYKLRIYILPAIFFSMLNTTFYLAISYLLSSSNPRPLDDLFPLVAAFFLTVSSLIGLVTGILHWATLNFFLARHIPAFSKHRVTAT